jgi:DnaJ-class molecular chaperone
MFTILKCETCDGRGYLVCATPARYHGKIADQPVCPTCKGARTITKPA